MDKENTLSLAVGQFLKKKRLEQNITIKKLSIMVYGNIASQSNISKIENGEVSFSIDTLEKISLALGINLIETFNEI